MGYQQYQPPAGLSHIRATGAFQPLVESLCLFNTWCSLVGEHHVTLEELQGEVASRGQPVYEEGWHSIAQLNAALSRKRSKLVLVKTALPRSKEWASNPFLRQQREGLFILSARIPSSQTGRLVGHFFGVDCWNRQFIDVWGSERRPMNAREWKRLNVKDWQRISAICVRD